MYYIKTIYSALTEGTPGSGGVIATESLAPL